MMIIIVINQRHRLELRGRRAPEGIPITFLHLCPNRPGPSRPSHRLHWSGSKPHCAFRRPCEAVPTTDCWKRCNSRMRQPIISMTNQALNAR